MIRAACSADLPRLQEVERAAGAAFRDLDMAAVADDEPLPTEVLAGYAQRGRAWVATEGDEVVAYVLADVVDGAGHVEQVSVHPSHAGRRLGQALVEQVSAWAAEQGFTRLTLTTFADVAWNAPYYARLGFRVLPAEELGEELRRIREREAEVGLDRWPRVAMSRPVTRG